MSASGEVKHWNDDKGYGFIVPDAGGDDVFVHRRELSGCEALQKGDKVQYTPEFDNQKNKWRASGVTGGTGTKGAGGGGGGSKGGGKAKGGGSYGASYGAPISAGYGATQR